MTHSTPAPKIFQSLADMQKEISETGLEKSLEATGKDGKVMYKARGIDGVYNLLSPLFCKHQIVIGINCLAKEREAVQIKHSIQYQTFVTVEYSFTSCLDGSVHKVIVYGESFDYSDKGIAKALSMAFKYACFQVFCIPVCDDPDATVHEKTSHSDYQQSRQNLQHTTTALQSQPKITKKEAQYLAQVMQMAGQDINGLLQHFHIQSLEDLNRAMYDSTITGLTEAGFIPTKITPEQANHLANVISKGGWNPKKLFERYGVNNFNDLPLSAYQQTLQSMERYQQEQQVINQRSDQKQQGTNNGQQRRQQQNNGEQNGSQRGQYGQRSYS